MQVYRDDRPKASAVPVPVCSDAAHTLVWPLPLPAVGVAVVMLKLLAVVMLNVSGYGWLAARFGHAVCMHSVGSTHSMASVVAQSVWLSTYAPHSTSITEQQVYRTCVQLVEALDRHCLRNTTLD